jgi:hypothetical protein
MGVRDKREDIGRERQIREQDAQQRAPEHDQPRSPV